MKIYKETISVLLWDILNELMKLKELESFRLVGGTSLSLLLGHRISVDIDLFTDAEYDSIDFKQIDKRLQESFDYINFSFSDNPGLGKSYFIGRNENEIIKLDLFYTDTFVYPMIKHKGLRLSQLEEIVAMKLEIIGQNGRKKDFWDIHELMEFFPLKEMLTFYEKRYPFSSTKDEIIKKLTDFKLADLDFDPICLKGKYWEIIKLDIEEAVEKNFR